MRHSLLLGLALTACAGTGYTTTEPWPISYQHPCPVLPTTPLPDPLPAHHPGAARAARDYAEMQATSDDALYRQGFGRLETEVPKFAELPPAFRSELVRMTRLVWQDWAFREGGAPPISDTDRAWYWRWKCHPDTVVRMHDLRAP